MHVNFENAKEKYMAYCMIKKEGYIIWILFKENGTRNQTWLIMTNLRSIER
jgi:hypothetical protein